MACSLDSDMPNFHHPHSVKRPSVGRSYPSLQTGFAMPPTERDFTQMVLSADHRIVRIAALTEYHAMKNQPGRGPCYADPQERARRPGPSLGTAMSEYALSWSPRCGYTSGRC